MESGNAPDRGEGGRITEGIFPFEGERLLNGNEQDGIVPVLPSSVVYQSLELGFVPLSRRKSLEEARVHCPLPE